MSISKKRLRSMNDIRTMSGTVAETFRPHKAYMKIACLELEKARREEEKSSATFRIANIDTRFEEIEAEKAALLQALQEKGGENRVDGTDPPRDSHRRKGVFTLRY